MVDIFRYLVEVIQNLVFLLGVALTIHFLKHHKSQYAITTLLVAACLSAISIEITEQYKQPHQFQLQNLFLNALAFSIMGIFFVLIMQRYDFSYLQMGIFVFGLAIFLAMMQSRGELNMVYIRHAVGIGIGSFFIAAVTKWHFGTEAPPLRIAMVWVLATLVFSLPIYLIDYSGM